MALTTWNARLSLAVIVAVLAADCGGEVAIQPTAAPAITLDGDLSDWPSGVTATADGRWLYIRIELPVAVTLQANREPHVIAVDYDGDAETGRRETVDGVRYGLDLQITFAPPADERDEPGRGVEVVTFDADGTPRRRSHAAVDLMCAPTYAARSFELRLSRERVRDLLGIAPTSSVRGFVAALDLDSRACCGDSGLELIWQFGADGLRAPHGDSALPDVALPDKPADAVRIVSWNVLHGSPMKAPAPFERVLRALAVDVVIVQEWDGADEGDRVAWFAENIQPSRQWHAVVGPQGVAIVSRLPLAVVDLGDLALPLGVPGGGQPVTFVAATVLVSGLVTMVTMNFDRPEHGPSPATSLHGLACLLCVGALIYGIVKCFTGF